MNIEDQREIRRKKKIIKVTVTLIRDNALSKNVLRPRLTYSI